MKSVQKMLADFEANKEDGVFPKIKRTDVAAGIKERLTHPEKIDQGSSSLCGPAALMFAVLKKSPALYVRYVTSLYDTGSGALGDSFGIWVKPGTDCKNCDPGGELPVVDWVALASLRDSENDFTDYQHPSDKAAGITPPVTLGLWLKHCGFSDRRNETNLFATKDKQNLELASGLHRKQHTVCLFCKGDTLNSIKGGYFSTPSHWVVMTRPAIFNRGVVSLQVFSWGKLKDLNMPEDTFFSTYFGFVSGKA